MTKYLNNPILQLLMRLIIGFIFLAFGASKLGISEKFASDIAKYAIMPEFSLNLISIILPWVEIVIGILLILGVRLRANALIATTLMVLFICFVSFAMIMGYDINCGCSSTNPQKVGFPKLLENSGLLLLSILIYMFPNKKFTLEEFIINSTNEPKI
ncbi:MAG TPA: MauE/DoxX family redox-associated membrane protein [Candidatus Kapabacteria bacterium]|nr:MauE/DoxX family redox-associated membrane protein [Candidatus Kapabacteria bacterium]